MKWLVKYMNYPDDGIVSTIEIEDGDDISEALEAAYQIVVTGYIIGIEMVEYTK